MIINRELVAQQLSDYLRHRLTLGQLVDWAEEAMREGDFDEEHLEAIRDTVARLGLADVRAFGLTWEDCEALLRRLGYQAHIEVIAARSA